VARSMIVCGMATLMSSCALESESLPAINPPLCFSFPTDAFVATVAGSSRVFPPVKNGCVSYQTEMTVDKFDPDTIFFRTAYCNSCEEQMSFDALSPEPSFAQSTIASQIRFGVGLPLATRDLSGATYFGGCGGLCTHEPKVSYSGPPTPIRWVLPAHASTVVDQTISQLELSFTDATMFEPGGGWQTLDYSGELDGLLVYPRLRTTTSTLSVRTSASLDVLCSSIGLAVRDDPQGQMLASNGELGSVDELFIVQDIGPLRLPTNVMSMLRSIQPRACTR